ncbi:MAG: ATPase, T2SS/T4P/T4SS family [Sporolactobacillus sp.]
MAQRNRQRLGDLLVHNGLITEQQLQSTLEQKAAGQRLGGALIERGYLSEQQLIDTLSIQLNIPQVRLSTADVNKQVVRMIDQKFARDNELIAYQRADGHLKVAMVDPLNFFAIDDLQLMTGCAVDVVLALPSEILAAINRLYSDEDTVSDLLRDMDLRPSGDDVADADADTPITKIINKILLTAAEQRASDVHVDPHEFNIAVRFRIDGRLHLHTTFPKEMLSVLVTRIKVMSRLDITERRLPQDGRVKVGLGKQRFDLRISILPTLFGERIVIRLLNTQDLLLKIPNVGFSRRQEKVFTELITRPTGLVLITGPTGSGKTSTLYAALNYLNREDVNIMTIEDPVEYQLDGVNQIQTNAAIGLTFAAGLRSILRQDPNIVMVGEIRDSETAEIAIRSSLTGHLVLSTLHTNDVATTVYRLIDMGVDPFLVSVALTGVIAQRLVRRVCRDCATQTEPTVIERAMFAKAGMSCPRQLWKGTGCASCHHTGYFGRTAVHEVLVIDSDVAQALIDRHSFREIQQLTASSGSQTMLQTGLEKVAAGITTVEELLKIMS